MNVGFWPFFSQRDKQTGVIRVDTCGASKQAQFLMTAFAAEGHTCTTLSPRIGAFRDAVECLYDVPATNPLQRIHWPMAALDAAFRHCDAVIAHHDYAAFPLSVIAPKARVFQVCAVKPDDRMFQVAWDRAYRVVVQTETMRKLLHPEQTLTETTVWPMCWNEAEIAPHFGGSRPIDVLFVQRCSSTNYTRHEEFLKAMMSMPKLRVAFVDVTRYLRTQRRDLEYVPDYVEALRSSKVAIALNNDGFGGQAIREAIVSGCTPVCLNVACYRELCGESWPYFCTMNTIATVCKQAVHDVCEERTPRVSVPYCNAVEQSYQRVAPRVLEEVLS